MELNNLMAMATANNINVIYEEIDEKSFSGDCHFFLSGMDRFIQIRPDAPLDIKARCIGKGIIYFLSFDIDEMIDKVVDTVNFDFIRKNLRLISLPATKSNFGCGIRNSCTRQYDNIVDELRELLQQATPKGE